MKVHEWYRDPNGIKKTKISSYTHALIKSKFCKILIIDTPVVLKKRTIPVDGIIIVIALSLYYSAWHCGNGGRNDDIAK